MEAAWETPVYRETALIVCAFIFIAGFINFMLRKKSHYSYTAWMSLRSWLIVAPILFLLMGLSSPWPIVSLTLIAILGAKVYFQIMGMFHRTYFIWICYAGIVGLGVASHYNQLTIYNEMPMIVLGACCMVPLILRSHKRMIQYISLTLLGFIFLGWSFMHMGLILNFENGVYQLMYLVVLTEFCDNTNLAIGRYFKGPKLFPEINSRRTLYSTLTAIMLTIVLAYGMRHLLPNSSEKFWLASGLIASFGGVIGDLVMSVFRRDAGVKIVGQFILGRGDFLQRMDRLIFVAPIYYFVMLFIS